uniref:NADH-ubiquinone oxidoreductase chain 6 n=1 Tax=Gibbovalva kobusi TaxID=1913583 RepID=A0A650FES2_9NEOP|nr:NADH dehydrogenase subunit 6 [Gibbovalva kobusi]
MYNLQNYYFYKLFFDILFIFFTMMTMMMISLFMYSTNHPLMMGLLILMQTLLTCLISGLFIKSYWFSYILFLTFLGGLLVLFIYISSMASNEMFFKMTNMKLFIIFFFLINMFYYLNFNNLNNFINNEEMINYFNNFIFFNNENKINLSKLYNNQNYLLTMILIIYLFITLLAIVKITNIFYGPLRSNF